MTDSELSEEVGKPYSQQVVQRAHVLWRTALDLSAGFGCASQCLQFGGFGGLGLCAFVAFVHATLLEAGRDVPRTSILKLAQQSHGLVIGLFGVHSV